MRIQEFWNFCMAVDKWYDLGFSVLLGYFFMEDMKEILDSRDYKRILLKYIFSTNLINYIFILHNICMSWNKTFITITNFLFMISVVAIFCT